MTSPGPPSASARDAASRCTLDAPGRLDRLAWIRAEVLPHVRAATRRGDGFVWECGEDARPALERWIALERACCADVSFALAGDGEVLRLSVRGDDPAVAALAALVPAPPPGVTRWRRLAAAGGLGAGAAVALLCLLPMALAAVFGAAVAAPLAGLESPASLAGAGLVFAAIIAFADRRRRRAARRRGVPAGTSPCGC